MRALAATCALLAMRALATAGAVAPARASPEFFVATNGSDAAAGSHGRGRRRR
jgi:hypothetical protein